MKGSCKECMYWDLEAYEEKLEALKRIGDEVDPEDFHTSCRRSAISQIEIACRYNPPTIREGGYSGQPASGPNDWCRKFQQRD